jgi:hypothetical protein
MHKEPLFELLETMSDLLLSALHHLQMAHKKMASHNLSETLSHF